MRKTLLLSAGLLLISPLAFGDEESFLTDPASLHSDERFGNDLIAFSEDIFSKANTYDSIMLDEPEIFIAADSPYQGFKPSDIAALADMMRQSMIKGLTTEPVSFGNYKAADKPGPGTLYLRTALTDVYIRKNKRGMLSYTPVGAAVKGVSDMTSDAIDKTTLVEMKLEGELQDSDSGQVLFAFIMQRGERKDKTTHTEEQAASWEATGQIAETLGRRLACRLDNARNQGGPARDCIKEIPM
jgi:hypothetical protein